MPSLPTGTVTFLFTDIAGSTALWERDREAMRAALSQHDRLLRTAIEARGGYVFKTVGDAFCAAFTHARDAVEASVAAQRALAGADWAMLGDAGPLRARMGLHTGEADEHGGDYFGPSVNRVARIEAAGHGGQILLSGTTRAGIEAAGLPPGVRLRDHGEHRLRDLRYAEHIAQVVVDGLPDVAEALRTAGTLGARDRIIVADPSAPASDAGERPMATAVVRTLDETLAALEAVVRGDDRTVVLTPEQVSAAARHKPADWREWRLGRIAEWSQPRYRLDGRFVGLTLLVDQGEEATGGRWQANAERYEDLGALVASVDDPAIVLLGPPGSGKSTLLRRLELDAAVAGLRGANGGELDRVSLFVSLSTFTPVRPGDPPPEPGEWLNAQWAARNPGLPPLDDLLAAGRVTLLLDALNEMPTPGERAFRTLVQLWKRWLQRLVATHPGNRVLFSCRALDYSQPLSTPELRVPQVRIEPLTNAQILDFLRLYSPGRWREVWRELEASPHMDVLRSPYFLALLVEQVDATGELPEGRAALLTGFVRQALRREVERGNALFEPGHLLEERDLRRIARWQWPDAYDLPERGRLLPKLATLSHAMQSTRGDGGGAQVRVAFDTALDLLDDEADEAIVAAGEALSILDEDEASGELMYIHQLVQEYFAARRLAREPDPELVRRPWRAADIVPTVEEVIAALAPADELPPLPSTGWEETTLIAAAMSDDADAFVQGVMDAHLALAGRAAALPEVRARLSAARLDGLRWALVDRSRDAAADLRDRIDCGYALGDLGDPRFARRNGPHGDYLWPPLVPIPGGEYPIGDDAPIPWSITGHSGVASGHVPRHGVAIAPFEIGQFPVTNAEWACFLAAGGYDDERWWETDDARRWRRGELIIDVSLRANRIWRQRFLADPTLFDRYEEEGRFKNAEVLERWRVWMTLDDEAFERANAERWRPRREVEPLMWRDRRLNQAAQPVVGVCAFEARAYCAWLSAQSGRTVRLPTEVEWEAAARGVDGRDFACGGSLDPTVGNTGETRMRRPSPVGVFPLGDTPEGLADMSGNILEWTGSLLGAYDEGPRFGYPYDPRDGREDPTAAPNLAVVVRGGSWLNNRDFARACFRNDYLVNARNDCVGLRVVVSPAAG